MSTPKIAVIFYSTYGTNHQIADAAADSAREAGAEVRLLRIPETAPAEVVAGQEAWQAQVDRAASLPEVTLDDMEWADGYFISVPTRFGGAASQYRAFVDTLGPLWFKGALINKAVTASATAQNPNGGVESTLMNIYVAAMHWGAIVVAPGYTDGVKFEDGGNPYGYSTTAGAFDETGRKSVAAQAARLVDMTRRIAG